MELFDSHCHLDIADFESDRSQVLSDARTAGVKDILVPGIDAAGWPGLQAFCNSDTHLHAAYGLHPYFVEQHSMDSLTGLDQLLAGSDAVAVGEIGLDYVIDNADHNKQQKLLEAQLELARNHNLPVVLHVRKAHDAMLQTLKRIPVRGGTAHAFSGSLQQAQQYIDLGFKLGFGGMLTFERSTRLRRLATELPLQAMVLETDAPDMTGARHQGQRNSPAWLPEVAETLAAIKQLNFEEIASVTTASACQVFGLGGHDKMPV